MLRLNTDHTDYDYYYHTHSMIIYQPGLTSCHVTEGLSPVQLNKQKKMNTSNVMCDKTKIIHVYYSELPLKAKHCSRLNVGGLLFDMME